MLRSPLAPPWVPVIQPPLCSEREGIGRETCPARLTALYGSPDDDEDDVEPPGGDDLAALDRAVTALEGQRSVLGNDVVETALLPVRERRTLLLNRTEGEQRKLVTVPAAAQAYVQESAAKVGDELMAADCRGRPVIADLLRVRPSAT
jgi:hypothetical protein